MGRVEEGCGCKERLHQPGDADDVAGDCGIALIAGGDSDCSTAFIAGCGVIVLLHC